MWRSYEKNKKGFTLLELLIVITIAGVLLTAISSAFVFYNRTYKVQELIVEMVQTARNTLTQIGRDIRKGGYNPSGTANINIPYNSSQIQIFSDFNGDGDTNDTKENITYLFDAGNNQIKRTTAGSSQTLARNIEAFEFVYLDEDGNTTSSTDDIRQIKVTLTTRTARPDPHYPVNGGYRTYTLSSLVSAKNLAF